jgi:hypothetical protein
MWEPVADNVSQDLAGSAVAGTGVSHHRRRYGASLPFVGRSRLVFSLFVRLGDGEFLLIASRDELEQARLLLQEFKANWPDEYYVLRDDEDNDVG